MGKYQEERARHINDLIDFFQCEYTHCHQEEII